MRASHNVELVFKRSVAVTCNQAHMGELAYLLRCLSATLLIALQEVAELRVVLTLLLLDGNDGFQSLLELTKVQVEVPLVGSELVDIVREDRNIALPVVLNYWQSGTISH